MSKEMMRTHVVVPPELVATVDRLVGRRRRSQFFSEAVQEKVARIRLAQAAKNVVGSLADTAIDGWETSEAAAEWVRESRRADRDKLHRLLEAN